MLRAFSFLFSCNPLWLTGLKSLTILPFFLLAFSFQKAENNKGNQKIQTHVKIGKILGNPEGLAAMQSIHLNSISS